MKFDFRPLIFSEKVWPMLKHLIKASANASVVRGPIAMGAVGSHPQGGGASCFLQKR